MTVERLLNTAHQLLREGRLDGAITAYAALLKERPDDWSVANRLGDLYVQTGRLDEAVAEFTRIARSLFERDLLSKAAAVYKKVLKMVPGDEQARGQLVDIALRQGFLVDAITHLTTVAEHRRAAGDDDGALEVAQRIAHLRRPATAPQHVTVQRVQGVARPPQEGDTGDQSTDMPRLASQASPSVSGPEQVPGVDTACSASDAWDANRASTGPVRQTEEDAEPAGEDRQLQLTLMLIDNEILAGRLKRARQLVLTVLAESTTGTARIVDLAKRMIADDGDATVMCVDALLEAAKHGKDGERMIAAARSLAAWVPKQLEGGRWPAERLQRLARIDAAARLELMRRESNGIPDAFPDLTTGAYPDGRPDSSHPPALASAVAAVV